MQETTPLKLDRVRDNLPMPAHEAATYLGVTLDGLAKLIAGDPEFPVHRLGRGPKAHRRFYRSELDAWLRSRCSDQAPRQAS